MENKCSQPAKLVDLKQLPPIDPFRIMNSYSSSSSSSSKGKKLNYSSTSAAPKVIKPSPNQEMKLVDCDVAPTRTNPACMLEIPSLGLGNGNDASSISSNKKTETCGNTTSHTAGSAHDGMKKGSARSNLYEICAANHWKPPIFECYKEEGPSHQRMFTFKVVIEMEAASKNIIECYGAPCQNKKTAADQAAEGALWYLKHIVMLSILGCQCSEDDNFLGEPLNLFPVKSRTPFLLFLKIQQLEIIPSSSSSLLDCKFVIS